MQLILALLLIPFSAVVNSYVLQCLWDWFLVPGLHMMPISIGTGVGISMVVQYLFKHLVNLKDESTTAEFIASAFVHTVIFPTVFLVLGKIFQLWLM